MIMYFMDGASGESFSIGADLVLYVVWQAGLLGVFGYLTSRINLQSVNQQIQV